MTQDTNVCKLLEALEQVKRLATEEVSANMQFTMGNIAQKALSDYQNAQTRRVFDVVRLHIWTDGDGSVGLSGNQAEVELPVDGFFDEEDKHEFVKDAKEIFGRAFSELWNDGRVHVATDDEIAAQVWMENESDGVQALQRHKG